MKVLRFLKRVGIVAIPILAVIMVTLVFYGILTLASNTVHLGKLYLELFLSDKMLAAYWIFASIAVSFMIYPTTAQYEKLDKKLWREVGTQLFDDGRYVGIAPNKRCKQGKAIAAVLASYKAVANHFGILDKLGIGGPNGCPFSITQLLRCKDRYFAFFDNSIRAEKCNPDFTEITIGEYEDLINSDKEG